MFNPDQKQQGRGFRTKNNSVSNIAAMKSSAKIQQLEEEDIKYSNRLEQIIKE
jgi:hypothetical protein